MKLHDLAANIFSILVENIPPENITGYALSYNLSVVVEGQRKLGERKPRNIIGQRLKEARLNRSPKITQIDLSALLSAYGVVINQVAISKIESGDRPVFDYELKAIGEALVVDVGWLINEDKL